MAIAETLLPEFDREMASTRRMLERVPEERLSWKPHEKSMSLGRLATHVAEIPGWGLKAFTTDELDVAPPGAPPYVPRTAASRVALLDLFERNAAEARRVLAAAPDADFAKPWSLRAGGEVAFTLPKGAVYPSMLLNHLIHHRGQLSVYLRLSGAPVPPTYGPTADEEPR